MLITIKLFATLQKGRFTIETREFSPDTKVCEVVKMLNIPEDEITLGFINGRHANPDMQLKDGDVLAFFPPVGGG